MKKRKIGRYVLGVIASILLLISLLVASIELGSFGSLSFYRKQYTKLEVAQTVDMELDDLMDMTKEMLSYLKGGRDDLDIVTTIGGVSTEFFNQKEKTHMEDVRGLNLKAIMVGIVFFILAIASYVGIYLFSKAEYKKARPAIDGGVMPMLPSKVLLWISSVTMLIGTGIYLLLLAFGALLVSTNFTRYWNMFHKIFFKNDLWLLNPDTDRLINIVPEEFFSALVGRCTIIYLTVLGLLLIFCIRKVIGLKREMQLGKRRFRLDPEDKIVGILVLAMLGASLGMRPQNVSADNTSTDYASVEEMLLSIPKEAPWPAAPEITAKSAILMEAGTGMILYQKEALASSYPASTTKILTAYLALNYAASNEAGDIVTYSRNAVHSLPSGASHIGLVPGEQLGFYESLCGLLLPSANEVANGLAEYVSGSIGDFVKKMNETATLLGAVNSHFKNPSGLHDEEHTTCAYDLAKIFLACLSQPKFIEVSSLPTYVIGKTNLTDETRPVKNTHRMLHKTDKYYDPRVVCGKTGTTTEAGGCLITYAKEGDLSLVCVILGAETPNQYEDTALLLDYGFQNFSKVNIAANDSRFYMDDSSTGLLTAGRNQLAFYQFDSHASLLVPNGISLSDLKTNVVRSINTSYSKIQYYLSGYLLGEAEILDATLSIRDYQSELTGSSITKYPYQSLTVMQGITEKKNYFVFLGVGAVLLLFGLFGCIYNSKGNARKRRVRGIKKQSTWKK